MLKHIRSRKGITTTEVVIALVIIAAISAVTLTMMMLSDNVEAKTENAMVVQNSAENAIECYRFAESTAGDRNAIADVFFACLEKTGGYVQGTVREDAFVEGAELQEGEKAAFRLVSGQCVVLIEIEQAGFAYTAKNAKGEVLYEFTYPEGGAS